MKNELVLENYGSVELNLRELNSIDGGYLPWGPVVRFLGNVAAGVIGNFVYTSVREGGSAGGSSNLDVNAMGDSNGGG